MISTKPPVFIFTAAGLQDLQQEYDSLTKERPLVIGRLQAAREMGDLSENGAYHAAKFELGRIDRRLRHLAYYLRYATVQATAHTGVVDFGSQVSVKMAGGQSFSWLLVSALEADPKQGKISVDSPIGQALLGKKVGDTAIVKAPAGTQTLVITKVE